MAQLIHDDLTDMMKKSNVVGDDATSTINMARVLNTDKPRISRGAKTNSPRPNF